MNVWGLLGLAIVFEVCGTLMLKLSDGFNQWQWSTGSIVCYLICFALLARVLEALPVGVTYAVWSGVGIVGVTAASYFLFSQKLSPIQIIFMLLIFIGAIGLNLTTKTVS